ncbi:hypothetical protein FIBSPDRAFT_905848 [Athelia psychrophila]|uniref:Uncharacterized protein n=1 Tax=Athelia psychrophila TaxID=1759441 RepID=A0A167T0J2_9AGAM|nr:hypothetical protein FIBSPDRAFT_905848 [Fibularhizoctonia sp. CBS 109695]
MSYPSDFWTDLSVTVPLAPRHPPNTLCPYLNRLSTRASSSLECIRGTGTLPPTEWVPGVMRGTRDAGVGNIEKYKWHRRLNLKNANDASDRNCGAGSSVVSM